MITLEKFENMGYDNFIDTEWDDSASKELLMHTIHAYPAKFPAFIASRAFNYALKEGVSINNVADIFCGCGTVALESKVHNYNFWGCDINPVATLIAKAKSEKYESIKLKAYYQKIILKIGAMKFSDVDYELADERLKYWFTKRNYLNLLELYAAIEQSVDEGKYKDAFKCIFSSILKTTSRWLMKSIKPQIDPQKKENDVYKCFERQYNKFFKAVNEICDSNCKVEIVCQNFLSYRNLPKVDLLITSPPYVTSYEYADLHQLSSLWLQYTDDYRKLRKGSIGSTYYDSTEKINLMELNNTAKDIVQNLERADCPKTKINSVAKYYLDMQKVIAKSYLMLNDRGMIFFVIGDTEYKGVKILNSKHLIECLRTIGFKDINIGKRIISKGICVPYRDSRGRFSRDKSKKKIYHEEYIISGRVFI